MRLLFDARLARWACATPCPWLRALGLPLLIAAWPVAASAAPQKAGDADLATRLVQAKALVRTDPDSAAALAQTLIALAEGSGTAVQQSQALMVLGEAEVAMGDRTDALAHYQKAELITDAARGHGTDSSLVLVRADLQAQIAMLHASLRNDDQTLRHYNNALGILEADKKILPETAVRARKVILFNNIAGVYLRRSDHAAALPFFQRAESMNQGSGNARNESALLNNIGICYMEMGRQADAADHFLQALALRKREGDVRGQAQVLNNMGKNLALQGRFPEAGKLFQEALALGRSIPSAESMAISQESLAQLYDTLGDHEAAFRALRAYTTLNDSLYNGELRNTIARMENDFRRQQERKLHAVETRRLDAENARRRTLNVALGVLAFFLLLTTWLLYRMMRTKVRNAALEQEALQLRSNNLELERQGLQENLESKDRELAANALFLLKKNELIGHIAEHLLKVKPTFRQEDQRTLQEVVKELQSSLDTNDWQEFEAYFTRVHSSFYGNLQQRFPALTPNERKLCAFLRLNMSTKDISAITHQSVNSITVARSRLRKKLQIEGEEVQLIDFLQRI